MKVLVVHDERTTADSIAEVLGRNGHHVLPLYSAVEALEDAEHLTFDVALIRLRTGPSVFDLGDWLRECMPRCKVILVVSLRVMAIAEALRGDFEYLPVSFKTRDLSEKVKELASHRPFQQGETIFSNSPEQF
jgi:DNA-binding NtrC family response regulator